MGKVEVPTGSLPSFVVIGAMKAGTTSVYHYLDKHPQINMSTRKELDFFTHRNWFRGAEWYRQHFPTGPHISGEASPNYSKYPHFDGVPERMFSLLPNARLIYLLRDPIERVISHLQHRIIAGNLREDKIHEEFGDVNDNYYVRCSEYYMQLERYLAYYPRQQIHIETLETLKKDPEQTVKGIFGFLGLDSSIPVTISPGIYNEARQRRRTRHGTLLKQMQSAYRKGLLPRSALSLFGPEVKKPVLSDELVAALEKKFAGDVAALRTWTGRPFDEWKYDYGPH